MGRREKTGRLNKNKAERAEKRNECVSRWAFWLEFALYSLPQMAPS